MNEMLERYEELYEDMATSGSKEKMMAFGEAEKCMFKKLAKEHPQMAQIWLDKLEAMQWKNYLSKAEAEDIVSKLINQNGMRGPKWGYEVLKGAVENMGGKIMEMPFYNCYALWVVMNMLYSDHHDSASEYVAEAEMPKFFYAMALEKLKDTDRPKFVRRYFDV